MTNITELAQRMKAAAVSIRRQLPWPVRVNYSGRL